MDNQKISDVFPGWKVTGMIGHGSFGKVYEVERDQFGVIEKAAVKTLTIPQDRSVIDEMYSDGFDDESIAKRLDDELHGMVKEYYMMAKLKGHTNIVTCDDLQYVRHSDGLGYDVFIRMELLTPLSKIVGKKTDAGTAETMALKLGMDICRALSLCEKSNIVHRDIKPQNIFLSEFGDYKLGDFGIAKTMEHTTSGTKTGTYKYMAPEVYADRPYGHSADIYSLGLVMYWLLNENRLPFLPLPPAVPTATVENQARAKRFEGTPMPEPQNGSIALKKIILKACAYEPKERYLSADEMLHALEAVMEVRKQTTAMKDMDKELQSYRTAAFSDGKDTTEKPENIMDAIASEISIASGAKWDDMTGTIDLPGGVMSEKDNRADDRHGPDVIVGAEDKAISQEEMSAYIQEEILHEEQSPAFAMFVFCMFIVGLIILAMFTQPM